MQAPSFQLRPLLIVFAATLVLLPQSWLLAQDGDQEDAAPKTNVLLIMVDDLGKEWISCYGASDIETPHIDALAATGVKFNNFYCMPQCTPTRATLLTGQYPFKHGWVNHWDVPRWGGGCSFDPAQNPAFPRGIREAGYATAAAGKWQIDDFRVEPNAMVEAGFDKYCMWTGFEAGNKRSRERYADAYVYSNGQNHAHTDEFGPDIYCDFLVDFIGENKDKPMFLYFPMCLTHSPWVATPDAPDAESKKEKHIAMVNYTDKLVGQLVAALEEHGIRDQTMIIFTTDNGTSGSIKGHIGDRTVKGGKSSTSENGVCVPFIVNAHNLAAAGIESEELVDMTDIGPTLYELAGAPQDERFQGKSFLSALKGGKGQRDWILAMGGGNHAQLTDKGVENQYWFRDRVIRNKQFKLFINSARQPTKLIDLRNDPEELENLLDSEAQEVVDAKKVLMAALAEMPERDSDPHYEPLEHREWYLKPKMESEVWKKGNPANN